MTLLLASALKSCALLLPALGASRVLRSAALRHAVLASAILSAAALPVLSLVLPHWNAEGMFGSGMRLLPGNWLDSLRPWALPIWMAGVVAAAVLIVTRLAWLMWLWSRCDTITEGPLADLAVALTAELRLPRPVTILRSDSARLLGTWGVDPKVVVPAHADAWSEERAGIVLRHELAHVRRYDWLVLLTAEIVRAIYWFNPLIWIAWRRLRDESEHACDAEVLRGAVDGREYAAHLVDIARTLRPRGGWWPAAAMARRSTLESRVRRILAHVPTAATSRRAYAAIAVATLAMTLSLALIGDPAPPRTIPVPNPRAQNLTLMLDGSIVDLSRGWRPTPDPNAGLVPGPGQTLTVRTN